MSKAILRLETFGFSLRMTSGEYAIRIAFTLDGHPYITAPGLDPFDFGFRLKPSPFAQGDCLPWVHYSILSLPTTVTLSER